MKALGIDRGAMYPGHDGAWKNDPVGVRSATLESLKEVLAITKEHKIDLMPEIHAQTPFEHPDDARRLLKEIPGIRYTYEPSHFILRDLDPFQTQDLLDGASHCHFRTCDVGKIQSAYPASLNVLEWMYNQLSQRNYEGILSIEYLPKADFPVIESIEKLTEKLAEWANK